MENAKQMYVLFLFNLGQPLAPYAAAVVIPLPPTPIHRLYGTWNEESKISTNKNYPQIAAIPASKVDKVVLTNSQIKEVDIIFGWFFKFRRNNLRTPSWWIL